MDYQIYKPEGVSYIRLYWLEALLLSASFLSPFLAWAIWRDGGMLARSGSVMVFFAVTAEFFALNKANNKHLLNACRAAKGEMPWNFSFPAKVVGLVSLVFALLGTLLWGFGDCLFEHNNCFSANSALNAPRPLSNRWAS